MSTIGCGEGKVQWLDSFHGEPSTAKQKLIADTLKTEVDEITVSIMNVQKQVGTADCGLFALAFVTAAVHGHNPTELYFDQKNMTPHLIESLQKMDVSGYKNTNEEKGHTETNYHSGLLYLPTPRIR